MNILITGATGFIGKHLLNQLLGEGHTCRCIVRNPENVDDRFKRPGVEFIEADITKPQTLINCGKGMDAVYHLAAAGHVADVSKEAYKDFVELNVQGTINIIEACAKNGVNRFIHFSSTAAMGLIRMPLIDESAPCQPQTPYQKSKYESELGALEAGRKVGMDVIVLRPCMVYGPGGKGEFLKWCRLIKKGIFPRVGLGKNLTPIVHVRDVVQAAIKALTNGKGGEVYLIASKKSPPLQEIYKAITSSLQIRRVYFYLPFHAVYLVAYLIEKWALLRNKPPVVSRRNILSISSGRLFSISKASRELGYNPVKGLPEGIKETISWYHEMKIL